MQLTQKSVVVSGRVRLARNYADLPFSRPGNGECAQLCIGRAVSAMEKACPNRYDLCRLSEISATDQLALVESHLISNDLMKNSATGAALIRDDRKISIMVNEEDHLRIQAMVDGLNLEDAAHEAFIAEEALEKAHGFSFDPQLGYLTSCPTNTGTGLRASLMLHLPMLDHFKQMGTVNQSVAKLGLTLRGIYGEGSDALGSVYQVSNQITLGRSEKDIIEAVTVVGRQLISMENKLRQRYLQNSATELRDRIMRSYGLLRYAVSMDEKELMQHWSHLRLGICMGMLPHSPEQADRLLTTAQDAHVKQYVTKHAPQITLKEGRCHLIQETLAQEETNPFSQADSEG
ncbi:MAG: ATP--guanido phosphotransferase [Clostridia bacterium]|nr:ATP--guanido phosphotransferase [Clostridia bacterium]